MCRNAMNSASLGSSKNMKIVLSGIEPESQVPETRMIAITP